MAGGEGEHVEGRGEADAVDPWEDVDLSTLPPPPAALPPPPAAATGGNGRGGLSRRVIVFVAVALVFSQLMGLLLVGVWGWFWFVSDAGPGAPWDDACGQVDDLLDERGAIPPRSEGRIDTDLRVPFEWYGADRRDDAGGVSVLGGGEDGMRLRAELERGGHVGGEVVTWQGRDRSELVVGRLDFEDPESAARFDRMALEVRCREAEDARMVVDDPWLVILVADVGLADEWQQVTWVVGDEWWSVRAEGDPDQVSDELVVDVANQVMTGAEG
jgi:hypothetical protein